MGVQLYLAHLLGQGSSQLLEAAGTISGKLCVVESSLSLGLPSASLTQSLELAVKSLGFGGGQAGSAFQLCFSLPVGHTPVSSSVNWDNNPHACLLALF